MVLQMFCRLSCRNMTKPTKLHVRPAKTQISLGIRPVHSESSLSAWRKIGSLSTHLVHSEDSDQTGRMPRLNWVFAGCICHFVGFVMRRPFFTSFIFACLYEEFMITTRTRVAIWAATWQNPQSDCAPSEESDQPGHTPSMFRVFAVRLMGS